MALRQLPPLDKKQFDYVESKLHEKPTKSQRRIAREAVEYAKRIKTHYP
jgi:hypothetical protein